MKRLATLFRGVARGAVALAIAFALGAPPSVEAKPKSKAKAKVSKSKGSKTVATSAPKSASKKTSSRLLPKNAVPARVQTRKPVPPEHNIVSVRRDELRADGTYEAPSLKAPIRLPAAIDYREGNLFSAGGKWIRVKHVSQNTALPSFRFGKREKFFRDYPLYSQEQRLLEYAELHLFPDPTTYGPKDAAEKWMQDLDSFLALHSNDPEVVRLLESFVLKYANQPPRGYLPGDQLWDNRRSFTTWNEFYQVPLQYDMNGIALTVDGKPLEEIPPLLPKSKLGDLPKLYPNVIRNLEFTFEALRTVMWESSPPSNDEGMAEATAVRRSYLTLKLLKSGAELWDRMLRAQR